MMGKSKFLKLNGRDFWRGLIVSGLTAGVTALTTALTTATTFTDFNWQGVLLAASGGFSAYISLNIFTNSVGKVGKDEKNRT